MSPEVLTELIGRVPPLVSGTSHAHNRRLGRTGSAVNSLHAQPWLWPLPFLSMAAATFSII